MSNDAPPGGITLALRAPTQVVGGIMDLALGASNADRAALLLLEEEGTLHSHLVRERSGNSYSDGESGEDGHTQISPVVRQALDADDPVLVSTTRFRRFPPSWRNSLARRAAVLAPLPTADGSLGLLLVGWDERAPTEHEQAAVGTSAAAIAAVLEAAIEAHVQRGKAIVREAALDAGREPVGKALAAIYLRSGLLRLALDDDLAADAEELEALARQGLLALRRSEERAAGATLSADLLEALLLLTADEE